MGPRAAQGVRLNDMRPVWLKRWRLALVAVLTGLATTVAVAWMLASKGMRARAALLRNDSCRRPVDPGIRVAWARAP